MRTLALLLLCVAPLAGQRTFLGNTRPMRVPGGSGTVSWDEGAPRRMQFHGGPAAVRIALELPFDVPGEPIQVEGRDELLVPGFDAPSGHGHLVRVRAMGAPLRLQLVESRDYGTWFDPWRLCWRAGERRLYVLDYAGRRLLAAPWDGAELPPLTAFVTAATSAEIPAMAAKSYSEFLRLLPSTEGDGVRIQEVAMCATHLDPTFELVRPVGDGFTVLRGEGWVPGPCLPYLDVAWRDRIGLGAAIRVRGATGTATLRGCTSAAHSGVFARGDLHPSEWRNLTATAPPIPGLYYVLECNSQPPLAPIEFLGLMRHGTPQATDAFVLLGGELNLYCGIGVPAFTVLGQVRPQPGLRPPAKVTVDLWMGARTVEGVDPVVEVNGAHVLREPLAVVHTQMLELRPAALSHVLRQGLPLPADRRLVGNVLLWQWAVTGADGRVAVSDVFGAAVLVPLRDATIDATIDRLAKTLPRVPEANRAALREWITTHPEWTLAGAARERWARASGTAK